MVEVQILTIDTVDPFVKMVPPLDTIATFRDPKADVAVTTTTPKGNMDRHNHDEGSYSRRHISRSRRHNRERLHFGKKRQTRKRNATTRTSINTTSTCRPNPKALNNASNKRTSTVGMVTRHRNASRFPEKQVLVDGMSDDIGTMMVGSGSQNLEYSTSTGTGDDKIREGGGGGEGVHHDDLSSISMDTDIESALSTLQGLNRRLQIAEDTKLELLQRLSSGVDTDKVIAYKDEQIRTLKIENRKFAEAMAQVEMEYMNKICDMHVDFHNKLKARDDKIEHLTKEFTMVVLNSDTKEN